MGTDVYGFKMIQVKEIEKIMRKERALLIDLRDEESFREGHMKYARNFPISYIDEWKEALSNRISLILYCEHGNQSLLAARKLRGRRGAVYTVVGGYQEYLKENEMFSGHPFMPFGRIKEIPSGHPSMPFGRIKEKD